MLDCDIQHIDTVEQFNRLKTYVTKLNPEFLVLDTETDSLNTKVARLFGLGICFNGKYAFYIPWRKPDQTSYWSSEVETDIKYFILDLCKKTKLIGHNVIYDVLVLETNWQYDLTPHLYCDTILLKHTLAEEPPFGLKEVAVEYLGDWANKAQQELYENIKKNGGKTTKDDLQMWKADTKILGDYCAWDVALTWRLFELFSGKLKEENLEDFFYKDEVMPLYTNVTIPMKRNGLPINVAYFQQLGVDLAAEINKLEDEIMVAIQPHVGQFANQILNNACPIKNSGTFPKALAEVLGAPLPVTKDGKVTLAKKAVELQKAATPEFDYFYDWILTGETKDDRLSQNTLSRAQKAIFFERHEGQRYAFNLRSNDHLAHLFFNCMGLKPLEFTGSGKPQVDDEFLEANKDKHDEIAKLVDFKKLNKLLSTYVNGILEREYEGTIYPDMLQFGTTSGRYASRNINCQNLPRIKEEDSGLSPLVLKYTNAIKKGFVAKQGYKLVGADYSSLEPVCFAHMSNEEKIRDIFKTGKDLYSQVAIDVNKLEKEFSADKKAPNFLKKHRPELRQLWKVPTLGIVYGMGESRLVEAIGCSYNEARKIINSYLTTYPNLKKYMLTCEWEAKKYGVVRTEFGRVRHLKHVQGWYLLYDDRILDYKWASERGLTKERLEFKNGLNNAKNFKIQSLAASIVNRAAIALTKAFKAANIDGYIINQVHDELVCMVREEQVEEAKKIMKSCMENTVKISVPLQADPVDAYTWDEAK